MTWVSGALLLILVFYWGGSSFLVEPDSGLSYLAAVSIGVGALFGSWLVYDLIWESNLARNPRVGHVLTIVLACVVAFALCHYLNGRAAFIHMGAVLGTWMVANVWMRIIPRQAKMVTASELGTEVDPKWSANAKNRSVHNNYFTLPIIFIMMSNHFPATYGHTHNWVFLVLIGIAGAAIRHYFNQRHLARVSIGKTLVPAFICLAVCFWMTSEPSDSHSAPETQQNDIVYFEVDAETSAVISGSITLSGKPPRRGSITLPQECGSHDRKIPSQSLIVNQGKLANALVFIKLGLENKSFRTPADEIVIDQRGCMYDPHVVGVQTHQAVAFLNSDDVLHNVRCKADENKDFNISMPNKGSRMTQVFERAEIAVHLKCNLHPWMGAYVGVFDHPYFSVTNEMGEFSIPNLPPGSYELSVWHETLGTLTQSIDVEAKAERVIDFVFEP